MAHLAATSARGGLVTALSQLISAFLRILSVIILARVLAPEIFGIVSIAQAIVIISSSLALLGLGMAGAQAINPDQNTESALFALQSAFGFALGLVLLAAAKPLANVYDLPELEIIIQSLSVVPFLQGLQSQFRTRLMRALRFGALALSELVSLGLAVTISVCMALLGHTYEAVVAQLLIQPTVQFALLLGFTRWRPNLRWSWTTEVRNLVSIGLDILGTNVFRNLARSAVTPIIGLSVAAGPLGQWDRAQQLAVAPVNLVVDQLQRVAVPVLSQIRDRPEQFLAYVLRAQLLSIYLCTTGFLILAAMCPLLVEVLLGTEWHLAGQVLALLAIGTAIRMLGETTQWIFIAGNASRSALRFATWTQPAIVGISLCGLPWGVLGVAAANTLAWLMYWPVAVWTACRTQNIATSALLRPALRVVLCFSIPTATAAALVQTWTTNLGVLALPANLAAATTVAMAIGCASPSARRDLKTIWSTLLLARGVA